MNNHYQSPSRARGFTLIEVLVSLFIFATMGVVSVAVVERMVQANSTSLKISEQLKALQKGFAIISMDMLQTQNRASRDGFGDSQPAIHGGGIRPLPLSFVRGRRASSLIVDRPQAGLQRVAYQVEEKILYRLSWNVLDQAQDSQPLRGRLLQDVEQFNVRFMDSQRKWHSQWPPEPSAGAGETPDAGLPLAIELSATITDLGRIDRIYRVGG